MKLDELAPELRGNYSKARGHGVTKLRNAPVEWQNIYFVVPKAPLREIEGNLPYSHIKARPFGSESGY